MPYADLTKRRACRARSARKKYAQDANHRALESVRKAEWLRTQGKPLNAAATARHRLARREKETKVELRRELL